MSDLTKKIAQIEDARGLDFHPLHHRDLDQSLIYSKLLSYVIMADGELQNEEKERFSIVVSNLGLDPEDCLGEIDDLQADELEDICKGLKDEYYQAMLMIDAQFVSKVGADEKKILDQIVSYCGMPADTFQKFSFFNEMFDGLDILRKGIENIEEVRPFGDANDGSLPDVPQENTNLTASAGNSSEKIPEPSFQKIINSINSLVSNDLLKDPVSRDITLYVLVIMKYKFGEIQGLLKKHDMERQAKKYSEILSEAFKGFIDKSLGEELVEQRENIVSGIISDLAAKKNNTLTTVQVDQSVFDSFKNGVLGRCPKENPDWTMAEKKAYNALMRELEDTKIVLGPVKFEKPRSGCLAGIIAYFICVAILGSWIESNNWACIIPITIAIIFWKLRNNKKTLPQRNSAIFDEKVAPVIRAAFEKKLPVAIEKSSACLVENFEEAYTKATAQFDEFLKAINQAILKLQHAKGEE